MHSLENTIDGLTYLGSMFVAAVVGGFSYGYGDLVYGRGSITFVELNAYGFTWSGGFKAEKAELGETISFKNGMRLIGGTVDFITLGMSGSAFGNALRKGGAGYSFAYHGYGGRINVDPKVKTTVLGSKKAGWNDALKMEMRNHSGVNFLDIPNDKWDAAYKIGGDDLCWKLYNLPFLEDAIKNGNIIRFVSDPTDPSLLYKNGKSGELTMFGREVEYLKGLGYNFVNGKAIK
jgi:hypothetical protein